MEAIGKYVKTRRALDDGVLAQIVSGALECPREKLIVTVKARN